MGNDEALKGNWWSHSLWERGKSGGTARCTFKVYEDLPVEHLHEL